MKKNFPTLIKGVLFTLPLLLSQCSDQELIVTEPVLTEDSTTKVTSIVNSLCPECTYVVPPLTHVIDGAVLALLPGSVIGLDATITYQNLLFRNIVGTPDKPIIIKNFGGVANIVTTPQMTFALKVENSKYFRITGGSVNKTYGIKLTSGHQGITAQSLSTNFEIDHVEVQNSGFAGIMAKTDPTCDDATIRGNFTMKDVYIHDNYVHDTGGEGMYIGNTSYEGVNNATCGVRLPHEIFGLKVYNNVIKNSGWEGIQVGCATKGAKVYGNSIENYGMTNTWNQNNGLQIGVGTGGFCYGNIINKGTGNGLIVMGLGDNIIYNNIIVEAGAAGIFCDERYTPGSGFKFLNNTIINPKTDGIRHYADLVPMNVFNNNIIVNPGSFYTYTYPRKPADAFIFKLNNNVHLDANNNYLTNSLESVNFVNPSLANYRLSSTSILIDGGTDISSYSIVTDFYNKTRLKGNAYDIGAAEFGN